MRLDQILALLEGAVLSETVQACRVTALKLFKKSRRMELKLSSTQLVDKAELDALRDLLCQKLGLAEAVVEIAYEGMSLSSHNAQAFFDHVCPYLLAETPAARALLMGAEAAYADGTYTISLRFGGGAALRRYGVDKQLARLLGSMFGAKCAVVFAEGEANTDALVESIRRTKRAVITETVQHVGNPAGQELVEAPAPPPPESGEEPPSDVVLGKAFTGDITPIDQIDENSGRVIVEGFIVKNEDGVRELRSGKVLVELFITDNHHSIAAKKFLNADEYKELKDELKKLKYVRIRGKAQYDSYAKEVGIMAQDIMKATPKVRMDTSEEKRVELHAHTTMSALDATTPAKALVGTAADWGHRAIAITDHGVVQAFPEAMDAQKAANKAGKDIKVLYGVECYLMGDSAKIAYDDVSMPMDGDFVVFDIETTGLSAKYCEIIELAGVKVQNGRMTERFSEFVKPSTPIPYHITELTRITNQMVADAPPISEVLPRFLDFADGCVLVAHNANFDVGFIKKKAEELGLSYTGCYIDTLGLSRRLLTKIKRHKLDKVAKQLGIPFEGHHRAINDAEVTAKIFLQFAAMMERMGIENVNQINERLVNSDVTKFVDTYHTILLAKNKVGLQNLYTLISESHLHHFYRRPRIPKSLLDKYREGLIVGSACEAGELFSALVSGKEKKKIREIAAYYDYLEIQPIGNNEFMIRNQTVADEEALRNLNREIVALGEELGKPVVATCDVHFLNPEDEVYRRILLAGQDFDDADNQAPLYLRTTREMLAEFSYLGEQKAYEVVVTNTNRITDQIEDMLPIPKDTYPPEMPGAEEDIQRLSMETAVRMYGEPLPEIVKTRMDKELGSIIKHGFSVMYMIAQKLVAKSLSDGYLVGSRGSVGSSFVAFLSGITEVNSLPPHYLCPNCKHSEFVDNSVYSCGADLPDAVCPKCGTKYKKEGYDIPFETFLGFDGDKEPDIDLNFSGEYQPKAHKYTEVLFGEGNVFRAGTIGTFAAATAFGYVKKYAEERGLSYNRAETARLVNGITGIKRTTGQHPGGIMVLPRANNIHEFTPVQHPADDNDTDIITTHFDYHSISGRLLKLDILGHDDPTMIRKLEDLTGLNAQTIPIDDGPTMSLFTGTEALGVTPEEIRSPVGTYAVPEFGTKFVRQMLVDTKPTTFSELIRISGLSHGTDVWSNNAQDLVRAGTATLPEVICTRDDIMLYLLQKGLEPLQAFKTMENVRKGRGLTEKEESLMREHNVPEWYIQSCKKIKYMFPKAHAAAYVTMGFRIAYYKVHYPMAFYLAYFTIRGGDFEESTLIHGKEKVLATLDDYQARFNELTAKEKNFITLLEVVLEMYARGLEFLPLDLYKSDVREFVEEDGKIRPPLRTVPGFGETAQESLAAARKDGPFLSVEDIKRRTTLSAAVIQNLQEAGVLDGLPATNQVSLFDF